MLFRSDFAWVANPRDVYTDPVLDSTGAVALQKTRVSSNCPEKGDPSCNIHESRWAFHVTLGEAF